LATGSYDRTVRLWDTSNFGCIGILTNRFEAGALAFNPDGKTLAVAGLTLNPLQETNRLTFWDLGSRQELRILPEAARFAEAVSFSKNVVWQRVPGERSAFERSGKRMNIWKSLASEESKVGRKNPESQVWHYWATAR